jgi:hypothetical protein
MCRGVLALALLGLCLGALPRAEAQSTAQVGQTVFAVTASNKLVQFNSAAPGMITGQATVSGLQAGEAVVGIDFRPATGKLVALGSTNRLYALDASSGAATLIGTQPFTSTVLGSAIGFDFNPMVDRIRLVSGTGVNLRLNPNTGALAALDTKLAYAAGDANVGKTPGAAAAAYTNNISGTASTQLYLLDATQDVLVKQGAAGPPPVSPNSGQLFTVGALGVDIGPRASFDIAQEGTAYVTYAAVGDTTSKFGTLDLATGKVIEVGAIAAGELVTGIAAQASAPPRARIFLPIVAR